MSDDDIEFLTWEDVCERARLEVEMKNRDIQERNLARFIPENLTIVLNDLHDHGYKDVDLSKSGYEIDLEQITCPWHLIDWIFHLRGKLWFTPQMLDDLLSEFQRAFNFAFGCDPRNKTSWQWKKPKAEASPA